MPSFSLPFSFICIFNIAAAAILVCSSQKIQSSECETSFPSKISDGLSFLSSQWQQCWLLNVIIIIIKIIYYYYYGWRVTDTRY